MTTSQEPRNYPFGEADRLELDPTYEELRRTEPVARVRLPYGGDAWLVTKYDDVKTVLSDLRFSRAAVLGQDVPRAMPMIQDRQSILSMDPPEHGRLRKLVAKGFTMRRVEQLRDRAQEIVDGLLDEMEKEGSPADLVEALNMPLPITIICEMLGVPYDDRAEFRNWSDRALAITAFTPEEITAGFENLQGYIAELVAERRQSPTDDVLGTLVTARDEGDRLTEEELVNFGVTLLVAGHETTANQLGNFLYTLLSNPDRLAELRADPDLVPAAVEELLRITPLGGSAGFPRIATEDVELSGVTIPAGDAVFIGQAGNRDPAVFPDPNRIDFHRENNAHVAFGHGVHHCVGAPLARMELQVAIGTLLSRYPALELAVPVDEVPFKKGRLVRGPRELLVRW
ncbi:cytochrome P450 [Umezawaea endophytica]|uniref:Cytochrome P450 n=1 Tax=Umezawaea endophytica TaxID=1654476 RepID=A0A9X3ADN0_9PSEU|nr:cytochrome P450 [Umezawaea endophytica]MCS7476282.1 cytochrome P450 [Umezawaea endophytica]